MAHSIWTREQTIVAFNIYCKIPFKESKASHPMIVKYANIIGRTPSALNMKIGNFGRLDPELKKRNITGLKNGAKLEKVIWEEFYGNWDKLIFESELLIAEFQNKKIEESTGIDISDLPLGKERATIVKTRVNQSFFRAAILANYNKKCCITGLSIPALLVASHIKPWSVDEKNRLNPQNGLCLNSLHDKAFDKGYMTISLDYKIKLSRSIEDLETDESIKNFFTNYKNKKITLPERFLPDRTFLEYHHQNIFEK